MQNIQSLQSVRAIGTSSVRNTSLTYGNAIAVASASSQYAGRSSLSNGVTTNISCSCWYKPTNFAATARLVSNGNNDGQEGWDLNVDTSGVFNINLQFTAAGSSGVTLSAGTWYQLGFTRAGSGTAWQLYVNGQAQGTPITNNQNTTSGFFTVGAWRSGGGTAGSFANGVIDEVRVYERQLSGAEMLTLYNRASDPTISDISTSSIRGLWKFNETSGTTYADSSGNTFDLTGVNTPTLVTGIVAV